MADPRIKNPPRDTPSKAPPPATTAAGTPPDHAEHVQHARQNYDYNTEHTDADADPGPEESYLPLIVAVLSALIALVAVVMDYSGFDMLGLILAIVALLGGLVSIAMGWTDARAGIGTPIFCTIVAAVVLGVVLLDVMGVDERVDPDGVNRAVVGDDDVDVPEDPADMVEGTPEERNLVDE